MAGPFRILIVDDEPDILESIKQVLELSLPGAAIDTATDGEEALAIIQDHAVDLILSDYKMPKMDGIQFLAAARRILPNTPRLLVTAYPDPALAARAVQEAGVGLFVAKPFDVAYIAEVLKAFARDGPVQND